MPLNLTKFKLNRQHTLREQVYDLLRSLILTGTIRPGEVIDEKGIAAQLRISRTPVREAVKKLSDEHLVDVVAQSGTRASKIDRREVEQAFIIRRALETESAAQAATRMTDQHAGALNEILTRQAGAIAQRQFAKAIVQDDLFHRYIAEISGLLRLWRSVEISKGELDRCRRLMLPFKGEGEATLEQHRKIIAALSSKDPERARRAMANHLESAYKNADRAIAAGAFNTG